MAEVGKREVKDYSISFYKLAQAASSSGVSQSLARADSAARVGPARSAWASFSDRSSRAMTPW